MPAIEKLLKIWQVFVIFVHEPYEMNKWKYSTLQGRKGVCSVYLGLQIRLLKH